jgi:hypothetical protein
MSTVATLSCTPCDLSQTSFILSAWWWETWCCTHISLVIHWQVYRDPSGGRGPVRITNATEPTLCGTTLPVGPDGVPSDAAVPSWVDQVPTRFFFSFVNETETR